MRETFLLAAELQFEAKQDREIKFSCYTLAEAQGLKPGQNHETKEYKLYAEMFGQRDFVWWGRIDNRRFDHESRIYALLLCAEMCRPSPTVQLPVGRPSNCRK